MNFKPLSRTAVPTRMIVALERFSSLRFPLVSITFPLASTPPEGAVFAGNTFAKLLRLAFSCSTGFFVFFLKGGEGYVTNGACLRFFPAFSAPSRDKVTLLRAKFCRRFAVPVFIKFRSAYRTFLDSTSFLSVCWKAFGAFSPQVHTHLIPIIFWRYKARSVERKNHNPQLEFPA